MNHIIGQIIHYELNIYLPLNLYIEDLTPNMVVFGVMFGSSIVLGKIGGPYPYPMGLITL